MFNLQGSEIIIILLLALVVLGPEKLPDAMRKAGKFYADIRKMSSGFQEEFRAAMDEPVREVRETANLLRDSADFTKLQDGERDEKPKSAEMGDAPAAPIDTAAMPGLVDEDDDADDEVEIGFATSGREPFAPPVGATPVDIAKPDAVAPPPPPPASPSSSAPPPGGHAPFPGSTDLARGMPAEPAASEPPADPFGGTSTLGLGIADAADNTDAADGVDPPEPSPTPAEPSDDPPVPPGGSEGAPA